MEEDKISDKDKETLNRILAHVSLERFDQLTCSDAWTIASEHHKVICTIVAQHTHNMRDELKRKGFL